MVMKVTNAYKHEILDTHDLFETQTIYWWLHFKTSFKTHLHMDALLMQ